MGDSFDGRADRRHIGMPCERGDAAARNTGDVRKGCRDTRSSGSFAAAADDDAPRQPRRGAPVVQWRAARGRSPGLEQSWSAVEAGRRSGVSVGVLGSGACSAAKREEDFDAILRSPSRRRLPLLIADKAALPRLRVCIAQHEAVPRGRRERKAQSLEAFRGAQVLPANAGFDSAASRAYYAAFHAVTALLALEDRTFTKHTTLQAAVHRNLVKAGRWSAELGRDYSFCLDLRGVGDYGSDVRVDAKQATDAIAAARRILLAIHEELPIDFPAVP
jgi:uncharacterized protein (UPF0332 family)